MAGNLTTYGANALLNGTAMPATLWVKGHLSDPGVDALLGAGVEDTRFSFTRTTSTLGTCSNSARRSIPSAATAEDWTHLSLWDDEFAGNPWWVVALTAPLTIGVGNEIALPANALVISLERWT